MKKSLLTFLATVLLTAQLNVQCMKNNQLPFISELGCPVSKKQGEKRPRDNRTNFLEDKTEPKKNRISKKGTISSYLLSKKSSKEKSTTTTNTSSSSNSISSSSSSSSSIPSSSSISSFSTTPEPENNYHALKLWKYFSDDKKKLTIASLLEKAGNSADELSNIEEMLNNNIPLQKKGSPYLLSLFLDPINDSIETSDCILKRILDQENNTHLQFVLRLLLAKIAEVNVKFQRTHFTVLHKRLTEYTPANTESLTLIDNIRTISKILSNQLEKLSVNHQAWTNLKEFLARPLPQTPSPTLSTTQNKQSTHYLSKDITIDSLLSWIIENWNDFKPSTKKYKLMKALLKWTENTPEKLSQITEMLTEKSSFDYLMNVICNPIKKKPSQQPKVSILQDAINQENYIQLKYILNILFTGAHKLKDPKNQLKYYELLKKHLTACTYEKKDTACAKLITGTLDILSNATNFDPSLFCACVYQQSQDLLLQEAPSLNSFSSWQNQLLPFLRPETNVEQPENVLGAHQNNEPTPPVTITTITSTSENQKKNQ